MEEVDWTVEHELLFGKYAASRTVEKKSIASLGKLTGRLPDVLHYLLRKEVQLAATNFSQLLKYMRVLARVTKHSKQPPVEELFSAFVTKVARFYLPTHITTQRELRILNRLAALIRSFAMREPERNSPVVDILLYMASGKKLTEALEESLLVRLQEEVFIDRKAREPRHMRLNPLLGKFVASHFKVFMPLLERLVVRSESNL